MSQFWSPIVHTLTPYVAGEQPKQGGLIKLNTNESPYGPSPLAIAAIKEASDDALRLYPDPTGLALRQAIAASHGLDAEEIFVGNGSDEVLAHTFQALLNHERDLLFPDITYSFYPTYCRLYGIGFRTVPLDDAMRVRIEDYGPDCGAIILPNPNAPTGIALPLADIEALVLAHPQKVVVIDEAYVDFGAESAVSLIRSCPNLLVVQTFSKSRGLAGLRVGFAMGQRHLIEALERVKDSFNSYPLDRLAQAGALASWQDQEWFTRHRDMLIASRERLSLSLQQLGFTILPSSANFVFARHTDRKGAELLQALRDRGVLVRRFGSERIEDFLRISIGTDEECDRLLDALHQILN
ncbi:histidinol-phosphate transaminase [Allorhizobium taibaishanense]|uniref:Histidinol-phosphate aminotransferase n=1 Tax=Allorhizobium taibaishanense TaxID=887144 RepID=A0A1Q9A5J7_9HYPH|nr:histidinol-phosphate transaminase [Allorhizobium taibaishanense]MBB4006204.1 histidinol-phosphate aminotransferase [Allorhizobium taibaishanense]OLP49838.1 histidinol-phosphate transaminase [Allorhizobium taibaishanense]